MSKKSPAEIISPYWDSVAYDVPVPLAPLRDFCPEEKLLLAVIFQAVEDATSPTASPLIRDQARTVIFQPSATNLKDMCGLLDIDYDFFKETVAKMIKEGRTLQRASSLRDK